MLWCMTASKASTTRTRGSRAARSTARSAARHGKVLAQGGARGRAASSARSEGRASATAVDLGLQGRAANVAQGLGSRAKLAGALNVSASQPTRWISGEEAPNASNARAIVDLDYVITRARQLWGDDKTVGAWLQGANAFLGGARPIDAVMTQGVTKVIDALDQEMSGAFA